MRRYDLAKRNADAILVQNFQVAIADECHYLKNFQAQRTKVLTPLLQRCKHVVLLSGTPAISRPKELFNLLSIIRPDIFFDFFSFGNRYCDPRPNPWRKGVMDYDGSSNEKELNFILKSQLMIRRLKKDVLKQLPPKVRTKVYLETEAGITKQIAAILDKLKPEDQENMVLQMQLGISNNQQKMEIFQAFTKCYQLSGEAKIKKAKEYIKDLLDYNDQKFILFAYHKSILDELDEFSQAQQIEYIRIDGMTNKETIQSKVSEFQNNPKVRLALLSIIAAGTGLTLTAASTVVFIEVRPQAPANAGRRPPPSICTGREGGSPWPVAWGAQPVRAGVSWLLLFARCLVADHLWRLTPAPRLLQMHWNVTQLEQAEDRAHRIG